MENKRLETRLEKIMHHVEIDGEEIGIDDVKYLLYLIAKKDELFKEYREYAVRFIEQS